MKRKLAGNTSEGNGMDLKTASRRLRDVCEPIAAQIYFVPEAARAYEELGLQQFGAGYFCSRGACLGRAPGHVIASAFGVFNPAMVVPLVEQGWTSTTPEELLRARENAAVAALRRMLGEAPVSRAVEILLPVMQQVPYTGRALFAGLRSLDVPDDPLGALWRACDLVRERRGDGHIAAWLSAGCDAVEIGLLTELYWGMQMGTYIRTRGWNDAQLRDGMQRLADRGLVADGAFTDAGRALRREIEAATDRMDRDVVELLQVDLDELLGALEPLARAVLDARGYPNNPAVFMHQD